MGGLLLLGCAGTSAVTPVSGPGLGRGVAQIQRDVLTVRPTVRTRWAVEYLDAAGRLPAMAPRRLWTTADGRQALNDTEAQSLSSAQRAPFHEETVDEVGYYFGSSDSPVFYARFLEILGQSDNRSMVGRRFLDLSYASVGPLRTLATAGAIAVGISASPRLRALYSLPGDQGPLPIFGRDVAGQLTLVSGDFPADPATRAAVGGGYDAVVAKNLLKRGYVHPTDTAPPETQLKLGMSDDEYLRTLLGLLRPGGRLIIYNLCPAQPPSGQAYNPHTDCRNPFPQAAWQAAGFRVIDYDRTDTPTARELGKALGWDQGPAAVSLDTDLFALYTLAERL